MKAIAINGSPKKEGNTYHALKIVLDELEKEGISGEIIHIGNKNIRGCLACGSCAKNKDEKCIQSKDEVNGWIGRMKDADGILLGSPVYYADVAGTMKAFLDRAFYVSGANGNLLRHKVGASVVAVRRSGGLSAFHALNNYLMYSEMLIPTSNYWNVIHGARPGEAMQDEEGIQIMKVLGQNMAWLMKLLAHAKDNVPAPDKEKKRYMNFVR